MTKKHFIALADIMRLKACMPSAISNAIHRAQFPIDPTGLAIPELTEEQTALIKKLVLDAVACELADFCIDQNVRFDRQRWLGYIAGDNGLNGGAR